MSQFTVRKSIIINAEPSQVWDALTNPEKTKKYFFHSQVISDWQEGSTITFKGRIFYFFPFERKGKIIKVEPNKLLQYTLENGVDDSDEGFSIVTDRLSYEDGQTLLVITDDVGDTGSPGERLNKSDKGWTDILSGLKKVVELGN
jgi:uncharacterized protein YndB with AHSA1/START domain